MDMIVDAIGGGVWTDVQLLFLLAVANSSPILATRLLGGRWSVPLDGGVRFFDGRPLLGPSKTVRGAVVAIAATALASALLGIRPGLGARIGAACMLGDALSSFVKRRLGLPASARATGLDQIPEAVLGLLAVQGEFQLTVLQVVVVTALFFALEIPFARLFFRLGIRDRPY